MNRPLVSVLLIVFAVAIGIFSLVYIDKTYEAMTALTDEVIESANADNATETQELLEKTSDQWEEKKVFLNILIGQQETNKVKMSIRMAEYFAELGDMESVILYINECKAEIERINDSNKPSLSTIL